MITRKTIAAILVLLLWTLPSLAQRNYPPHVKSIVENRCVVCHGCYDAPCQLKLDARAGLERGASKDKVYDGTRLLTAKLTRLLEDANTTKQWRDKGFYPVLDRDSPDQAVIARMLELKKQHPLPRTELLPDAFDLRLNRDQQCPKAGEFDEFAQDYPLWGMPYALPGLNIDEHKVLSNWLEVGAPSLPAQRPPAAEQAAIKRWEKFLNGRSLKQQLMARYIYEHLFVGALYFSDLQNRRNFYSLVRSRTPTGQDIDLIATRRPYDAPGQDRFYYRLRPLSTTVLDKRHLPYALNKQRLARWQSLFLADDYTVTALPSYKSTEASNPFLTYRELPQNARYRFMLEEAQFTIMGFIKGPVCRGQVALNVIDDHFWVVFLDPDRENAKNSAQFLAREADHLRLPVGKDGLFLSLVDWISYSKHQEKFLASKAEYIYQHTTQQHAKLDLDLIWDGDSHNHNAALTIFRHFDSASVIKGLVGQPPKTAWVIDYSLLERIHYLLVAGFDVYGNVGHQLETRLYMDFLRMEGEQNFLYFLPADARLALRDHWYRGAGKEVKAFVLTQDAAFKRDTDIQFASADPKSELMDMLKAHQPAGSGDRYALADTGLAALQNTTGANLSLMPEVSFVEILGQGYSGDRVYTLLHNSGFSNNTHLFQEDERRIPAEDSLTIARGFVGSYPNVFFQVPEKNVGSFVRTIQNMKTETDYARLVSHYGVRRTAPWFWRVSDKMSQQYRDKHPIEAGLFDLNRYENR